MHQRIRKLIGFYSSSIFVVLHIILLSIYSLKVGSQDTPDTQPHIDKLLSISYDSLTRLSNDLLSESIDSSIAVAEVLLMKAENEQNSNQIINSLNLLATHHNSNSNFQRAAEYIDIAIEKARSAQANDYYTSRTYYNAGYVYFDIDPIKAFRYYHQALKEAGPEEDSLFIAAIYGSIGAMFKEAKNYDKAFDYYQRAKVVYDQFPDYVGYPYVFLSLGEVSLRQGKYHEAIIQLKRAEELFKERNDIIELVDCKRMIAESYDSLGLNEKSFYELRISSQYADSLNYTAGQLAVYPLMATKYLETDLKKAERLILKAHSIPDTYKLNHDKATIYEVLAALYQKKGELNESLTMYKLYSQYKDSTLLEYNNAALMNEELKEEYAKIIKHKEHTFLNEKKELTSQKMMLWILILCSLAMFIGAVLIGWRKIKAQNDHRDTLLQEIETLKSVTNASTPLHEAEFLLDRVKIESKIGKSINDTDWKIMNILLEDPVISNKGIAQKAFLSIDGIGSALRRMYKTFDIKESRYMKVSLLMELMKISR